MTPQDIALAVLVAAPAVVVATSLFNVDKRRLRVVTVVAGLFMLGAALSLAIVFGVSPGARVLFPSMATALGPDLLRVDGLSAALVPLPAALWILTVAVTPRSKLERAALPRTATSSLMTTLAFLTTHAVVLWVLWTLSTLSYLSSFSGPKTRRPRRVAAMYLGLATVSLGLGVAFMQAPTTTPLQPLGQWLIVVAVLIRKGIFPFHAWVPEMFDRGPLGPSVVFSAPQLGSYVAVVLLRPHAGPEVLHTVAALSLVTALHGAALALYQADARRACGYLFISQSALVLAGLDGTSPEAVAGALVLWISSAFAFTGISRCVLVLEARRGRLDLRRHHGGYEQMPLLAPSFLGLGLSCTGFPGTLGFAGEELLISGTVTAFPLLGFAIVITSALTGLAVLRMYYSLFCGRPSTQTQMPLLRRETLVFGALAAFLIATGIAPGAIVASRMSAGHQLLQTRADAPHEVQLPSARAILRRTR